MIRHATVAFVLCGAVPLITHAQVPTNRYIVEMVPPDSSGIDPSTYSEVAGGAARVWYVYEHEFYGFSATLPDTAVVRLRQTRSVRSVESDEFVHNPVPLSAAAAAPNPRWYRATIGMGSEGERRGTGVLVYIVDSGIRTNHVEFGGRASVVHDVMGDENVDGDCNGHGTHIASLIGGEKTGVAPGVRLAAVRVLDCDGFGTTSSLLAGLEWLHANAEPASVVNLSLSTLRGRESPQIAASVNRLISQGLTVVAAAGNHGNDACRHSPGDGASVITVAAADQRDRRPGFSNYGRCVKLFAPGKEIYAASNGGDSAYTVLDGTSQATAIVSGAAALIIEANRGLSPGGVAQSLYSSARDGVQNLKGSPDRILMIRNVQAAALLHNESVATNLRETRWKAARKGSYSTADVQVLEKRAQLNMRRSAVLFGTLDGIHCRRDLCVTAPRIRRNDCPPDELLTAVCPRSGQALAYGLHY